jgi:hypothetical protein
MLSGSCWCSSSKKAFRFLRLTTGHRRCDATTFDSARLPMCRPLYSRLQNTGGTQTTGRASTWMLLHM